MDDDTGTVYGKSGFMNYGTESGHFTDGRFSYKSFIFRGRSVDFDKAGYLYKKASITSDIRSAATATWTFLDRALSTHFL